MAADLYTDEGADSVAEACATEQLTMLVNNAGVAHYMQIAELPAEKARELRACQGCRPDDAHPCRGPGMLARGEGTIINVAGMIAFSGPARSHPAALPRGLRRDARSPCRDVTGPVGGTRRHEGVTVQVLCPGVVATEFHERQGLDLSAVPRMTAEDVVTASLRGLELGEVVCAPGVEDAGLLQAVFEADLTAFGAQSPELARRYRTADQHAGT